MHTLTHANRKKVVEKTSAPERTAQQTDKKNEREKTGRLKI